MNIYLMRHGIAAARDDASVKHDGERPLTAKGTKRMRKAAKGILRLAVPFDCVLTSPLLRARQTAEVLARALAIEDRLEEISGSLRRARWNTCSSASPAIKIARSVARGSRAFVE